MEDADGEVAMVSDEFNEDLLMAQCVGMTTIWLENDDEEPYRRPDHAIDGLGSLGSVLEELETGR